MEQGNATHSHFNSVSFSLFQVKFYSSSGGNHIVQSRVSLLPLPTQNLRGNPHWSLPSVPMAQLSGVLHNTSFHVFFSCLILGRFHYLMVGFIPLLLHSHPVERCRKKLIGNQEWLPVHESGFFYVLFSNPQCIDSCKK